MEPGKGLTRRQFDEVIRRAAELAAKTPDGGEEILTEAEVFRIAREVGLEEEYVRRALAEVRSAPPPPAGLLDRWYGPSSVRVVRVVKGSPEELGRTLEDFFLGTRLLRPVRSARGLQMYRRARDLGAELARAFLSIARNSPVANAEGVSVRLEPLGDGHTLVELEVEPGRRGEYVGAGLGGGAAGGVGVGVGVGVALAASGAGGLAVALGGLTGGLVMGLVFWLAARAHRLRVEEARVEAEGILDRVEGGLPLSPPGAPWRRWVRKYLDGLAGDVLKGGGGKD